MARFRKRAFDWKPSTSVHGGERYRAALENGHVLTLDHDPDPRHGWNWALFVPAGTISDPDGSNPMPVTDLVAGGGARWRGLPGAVSSEHLPTRGHAQSQAEEAYRRLYPLGADTGAGRRDHGIDYESVINPRQELDDDFGDIFRGGR